MVITFCFHQFLIGRLWAEILTAILWRKSVKSWRAPIFCWHQYLWRFCMAGRYNKPVQCGRESTHKSRGARGKGTLGDCMWRDQHLLGDRKSSARSGRSQRLWTLPCQTVRRCFRACANILSTQYFCRREISVGASILSTRVFCQRQHFVNTSILSTATFCRHQHFVDANILSTPTFCRRQHFVDANILSMPIFCRCQYFLSRQTFLSAPIFLLPQIFCGCQYFCLCLGLRMIIYYSDFVLCISWLICLKPFRFRPLVSC
jgi:hypothetical protein